MTTLRFTTSALFVAAALVTATGHRVSAMPARPLAAAAGDVVVIACQRGGPNCLPTDPRTPEKCGGPGNPCVIDGGPDCQNASSCGTDNTGDHNLNGASNMPGVISDSKAHPTGGGPAATKPVAAGTMKAH